MLISFIISHVSNLLLSLFNLLHISDHSYFSILCHTRAFHKWTRSTRTLYHKHTKITEKESAAFSRIGVICWRKYMAETILIFPTGILCEDMLWSSSTLAWHLIYSFPSRIFGSPKFLVNSEGRKEGGGSGILHSPLDFAGNLSLINFIGSINWLLWISPFTGAHFTNTPFLAHIQLVKPQKPLLFYLTLRVNYTLLVRVKPER